MQKYTVFSDQLTQIIAAFLLFEDFRLKRRRQGPWNVSRRDRFSVQKITKKNNKIIKTEQIRGWIRAPRPRRLRLKITMPRPESILFKNRHAKARIDICRILAVSPPSLLSPTGGLIILRRRAIWCLLRTASKLSPCEQVRMRTRQCIAERGGAGEEVTPTSYLDTHRMPVSFWGACFV